MKIGFLSFWFQMSKYVFFVFWGWEVRILNTPFPYCLYNLEPRLQISHLPFLEQANHLPFSSHDVSMTPWHHHGILWCQKSHRGPLGRRQVRHEDPGGGRGGVGEGQLYFKLWTNKVITLMFWVKVSHNGRLGRRQARREVPGGGGGGGEGKL